MVRGNGGGDASSNIPLLVAAFLAAITTGGNIYAFGIYGSALKKTLRLTQSQLDTISSANFCAGLLSWIPGGVSDRWGPRFALTFGGLAGATSMLCYWMVAREFIQVPHSLLLPTLCLFGILVFMSNSMVIGGIFKIFVLACKSHTRGSAVGAAKGYVGLGSGVYVCTFRALQTDNDLDFLPFAAVCTVMAATIPARVFLPNKEDLHLACSYDKVTPLHLTCVYVGLMALGSLVVGTSIASIFANQESPEYHAQTDDSTSSPRYVMAFLLLSFWFGPILALLLLPTNQNESEETEGLCPLDESLVVSLDTDEQPTGLRIDTEKSLGQRDVPDEGRNLWRMLRTVPAWIFAWICTISVGSGIIMTNNMGEMVESLYLPEVVTPASLALFSAAQAVSRVVTGATSDAAQRWTTIEAFGGTNGIPRPAFLIAASLAGALAHFVLAIASSLGTFVVGVALSGAAFGMIWPLMVLIVGEVFGAANVGANYMFYDGFSSACGTLLLSKFLAQSVYESHIKQSDKQDSDGVTCYGEDCFRASHIVIAVLCLTCVVASIMMLRTTRDTYSY